jgi:predicted nucleic acid-binding protein
MNGYLLDTNVISEYSRKKLPDDRLRKWVDSQNEATLYLSVLTLGEIRKGATLLPQSKKRTELENWLENELDLRLTARSKFVSILIGGLPSSSYSRRGCPDPC